jgi:hypothetical protein
MKFTKRTIAGAVAGAVLAGGAAFAAVSLWGSGTASVAATKSEGIVVDNVKLTKPLVPGGAASDATGDAYNPNDFAVKITGIVVLDEGQVVTGCTADANKASVKIAAGTAVTSVKVSAAGPTKTGRLFPVAGEVTIPAKQKAEVRVNAVVSQEATATEFCGFNAKLGVEAVSAGN